MQWILQFQLYLFDLDGLLVNTEELHYKAYKRMLHDRGYNLLWDFPKYFSIAQQDAEAPKRYIYAEFDELLRKEPDWHVLYAEKKKAYADLLETESAPLMPGVEELLLTLKANNKKLCVVTHSARSFVDALCRKKSPAFYNSLLDKSRRLQPAKACSRWLSYSNPEVCRPGR